MRVYTEVAAPGAGGGTAAALSDADTRLDAALVTVTSMARAVLVQRWRTRIAALLG